MTQYELIPLHPRIPSITLNQHTSTELAHEDDPATSVMQPLTHGHILHIASTTTLDEAIQSMKTHQTTLILVTHETDVIGVLSSEDVLGEKPIMLQQQSRIQRENIVVKMLMTPLQEIISLDLDDVLHARVGNVVATLIKQHQHYAIVTSHPSSQEDKILQGIFNASQISKQLHKHIEPT